MRLTAAVECRGRHCCVVLCSPASDGSGWCIFLILVYCHPQLSSSLNLQPPTFPGAHGSAVSLPSLTQWWNKLYRGELFKLLQLAPAMAARLFATCPEPDFSSSVWRCLISLTLINRYALIALGEEEKKICTWHFPCWSQPIPFWRQGDRIMLAQRRKSRLLGLK